jgi:hypothetical protein
VVREGVVYGEGVDRDAPVGLTDVRITFQLDTDTDGAATDRPIALAERDPSWRRP